jgi:hypothetical protein
MDLQQQKQQQQQQQQENKNSRRAHVIADPGKPANKEST